MAILRMSNIFADSADRLPKEARAKLPKIFKLLIANPRHPPLQVKRLDRRDRSLLRLRESRRLGAIGRQGKSWSVAEASNDAFSWVFLQPR